MLPSSKLPHYVFGFKSLRASALRKAAHIDRTYTERVSCLVFLSTRNPHVFINPDMLLRNARAPVVIGGPLPGPPTRR